jgi:hypothetical protein
VCLSQSEIEENQESFEGNHPKHIYPLSNRHIATIIGMNSTIKSWSLYKYKLKLLQDHEVLWLETIDSLDLAANILQLHHI